MFTIPNSRSKGWITISSRKLPVMYSKTLFTLWGRALELHVMVRDDKLEAFHSHPARAIRLVLWGGYTEEICVPGEYEYFKFYRSWWPGRIGIVKPDFVHRLHAIHNKRYSISLWFRGRIRHPTNLIGEGWN